MSQTERPRRVRRPPAIAWFTLGAFVVYSVYALTRYRQFLAAGYDLGIFDQAVRRYAHFQTPLVALKGDSYNILGDHFHPILAVLAPLYWIWDDPRMLMIAQAAIVSSSIPVIFAFFGRMLGAGRVRWLLIVGYAISWPIERMIDFDIHEICFAVPLLAVALDGLSRRSDKRLLWGAMPLLLVREDMGMVLAMLGVLRLLRGPRRWIGAVMIAVGVATFELVTSVVLPHFASNGTFAYWSYTALGADAPHAVAFILEHPLKTIAIFFTPWVKTRTLLYLFGPLLFLPLLSPITLVTLPLLAQRFLSSRSMLWNTQFHYSAPIMIILVFASIDGLLRVSRWFRHPDAVRRRLALLLGLTQLVFPVIDVAVRHNNYPLTRLAYQAWVISPHVRDQEAVTAAVPHGVCVEADDRIASHLTHTNRVTLPGLSRHPADFVVLDMTQKDVGFQLPSPQIVQKRVVSEGYDLVMQRDTMLVYRRPGYSGPSASCSPWAP